MASGQELEAAVRPGSWQPLGARFHTARPDQPGRPGRAGTNFALWAPGAEAVDLCLFDEDGQETRHRLTEQDVQIWHGFVPGVHPGTRYGFRVHGRWDPWTGARWNPAKLLLDPYARAIDGCYTSHDAACAAVRNWPEADVADTVRDNRDSAPYVPRSVVVHDEDDWYDDHRPKTPWPETVLYELHVRGFTMRHPDIPPHLRGTYAGLAHPAAISHLTRLGVTAVELLPVHQFASEDHLQARGLVNYWGYNTIGYFAPHAGYSSSGSRGGQVGEFKRMVRALHAAGIEVILDVVFNHTAEGGELGPMLSLRGIDNAAYYRLPPNRPRGYADYTGCGNTLDTRRPQVVRLVTDSLRYWVAEMGVDGFRFDLAAALARGGPGGGNGGDGVDMDHPFLAAVAQDPLLSRVKLIAEPWDVGPGGYQVGGFPPPWAEWNDKYRDAVRDFWRGARADVRELGYRLSGSSDLYQRSGRRPYASVNFVTAHDGFTLRDLVSYDRKHNEANGEANRDGTDDNRSWNHGAEGETTDPAVRALRLRQLRNLIATLLLSAGVPMLTAGDELGRTQGGNNNAYCQDNEASWLDWSLLAEPGWQELCELTARLVRLRRAHPVLRRRAFFSGRAATPGGRPDLAWFTPLGKEMTEADWFAPTACLGMLLCGTAMSERDDSGEPLQDDSFLLLLNADHRETVFTLPGEPWAEPEAAYETLIDTAAGGTGDREPYPRGAVLLAPRSLHLLRIPTR
ncbi:glycogen operon protein [Streptomyces sp. 1114.5]|uniref:glycogen debranching protein GlgX n=1 Tax=Streptomyces sp. 1114.5 TaxID=1938830 RepID=UPI000EB2877A|nr:glycogen debranching protein GlgX [Streptomyces sp. 1114.5]RKT15837.1 glycogen operon protein [Streptomyces sp. 1114.5]